MASPKQPQSGTGLYNASYNVTSVKKDIIASNNHESCFNRKFSTSEYPSTNSTIHKEIDKNRANGIAQSIP